MAIVSSPGSVTSKSEKWWQRYNISQRQHDKNVSYLGMLQLIWHMKMKTRMEWYQNQVQHITEIAVWK